jgi:hypothetical protein
MAMPKIIGELASLLKMPVASQQNSVYSMVDGYPVQFFEAADGNSTNLRSIIRFDDPSKDALVMNAVSQSQSIAQTQLKPKYIEVAGGIVSVKWVKGITGYAKTEKILEQFVSVFNTVKSAVSGPGLKCRVCGVQELVRLSLLTAWLTASARHALMILRRSLMKPRRHMMQYR